MNPNKTEIAILLDRSGSMYSIKSAMESAFDELIQKQRELPGECNVSLYQFDSVLETVYEGTPIKDMPSLKLEPRDTTRFYGSAEETIRNFGKRLARMKEEDRPGNIMFVIITDGLNNMNPMDPSKMREMIQHQTDKYKWQFFYLGADHDSYTTAQNIGVKGDNVMNYVKTAGGARGMSAAIGVAMCSVRSNEVFSGYTAADRIAAADGDTGIAATPDDKKSKK